MRELISGNASVDLSALMSQLAAVVLPVVVLSAAGYWWGRRGRAFDHAFVAELVTLVGAPCLVFSTLSKMRFPPAAVLQMGAASLATVALFAAVGMVGLRLARLPVRVYLPSLIFPNTGNIGLPVCLFAFGQDGLALAVIYYAFVTVLQFSLGPAMVAGSLRLSSVLRMPFIYAVVAALVVGLLDVPVPAWITNTTTLGGGLAIPLMLVALGVALAELKVAHLRRALVLSAARLVLGLAGGWAVAVAFGLSGPMKGVLMIQGAMPVAIFNYLFARLYDSEPEEVAGMVLLSTLMSYATLPLMVGMLL